jgi:hypothetical protein
MQICVLFTVLLFSVWICRWLEIIHQSTRSSISGQLRTMYKYFQTESTLCQFQRQLQSLGFACFLSFSIIAPSWSNWVGISVRIQPPHWRQNHLFLWSEIWHYLGTIFPTILFRQRVKEVTSWETYPDSHHKRGKSKILFCSFVIHTRD